MWTKLHHLTDVPPDRDVRLAVIDTRGVVHALVFPCRRSGDVWVDGRTGRPVEVYPTHWQPWSE